MKILFAEDEKSLSRALTAILTRSGYDVDSVYDGQAVLDSMESDNYDAIILDVMMPKMDGITVLKNIRKSGNQTPVLMLTAKSETDDKVLGLDSGANDYLTKPFDSKELLARLRVITRLQTDMYNSKLSLGNVVLDRSTFELSTPTGVLRLANKEFQMLEFMMSNPKNIISSERFLEKIWSGSDAEADIVWMYISYLKQKLSVLHADIQIKEYKNVGYRAEAV